MSKTLKSNKFFTVALIISIILAGMSFGNLPGPMTPTGVQTVNGETFNFADYRALTLEELAIYNFLTTLFDQPYGSWDGWYIEPQFYGLFHYVLAFMAYSLAMYYETTPGYRTSYYESISDNLIRKFNTSVDDWGNDSIEYFEWEYASITQNWTGYYYPDTFTPDADDLYTGGFRGPANIMWTGHFALMELLHERNFNTGEFLDEITYYMEDWNNSMTTDGFGNPQEGGIWECGLIPCEPYAVWVQCTSIPIYATGLYDGMFGTNYMPIWDYGLEFSNTVMQDQNDLYVDGYYVQEPFGYQQTGHPVGSNISSQEFPGNRLSPFGTEGNLRSRGYGVAWSLEFLDFLQPEITDEDYPVFIEQYGKEVSGDQMYFVDSMYNTDYFGTFEFLACLFTLALSKQEGDFNTVQRILNFLVSLYNKVWSADGREMHWDTSALEPFLQTSIAYGWIWANNPVTLNDLVVPRPTAFWDYPYISEADDENIWVYQAEWDPVKEGFILNIKVDQAATLIFSNFDSTPTVYGDGPSRDLTIAGSDYSLILQPGSYYLVIM
ncbi:MAG: hypothetical protein ACXABV_15450 [Candidatus Thorarchaeota archaeon]